MIDKIIISGYGGSGKDSFGDYLVDNYGFKKLSFSDGIYDIAYKYFGMTHKNRWLLQSIGEKMREIDPFIWIKHTFDRAEKYDKVIISDCRQGNEYEYGLKLGYLPIRIEADLDTRIKRLEKRDGFPPDMSLFDKECETGADDYDYITVDNNGDFEHLHRQADEIIAFNWDGVIEDFQEKLKLKQI